MQKSEKMRNDFFYIEQQLEEAIYTVKQRITKTLDSLPAICRLACAFVGHVNRLSDLEYATLSRQRTTNVLISLHG